MTVKKLGREFKGVGKKSKAMVVKDIKIIESEVISDKEDVDNSTIDKRQVSEPQKRKLVEKIRVTEAQKISKAESDYRDPYQASPLGDTIGDFEYRCDRCMYFQPSMKKCLVVKGEITASAGCKYWIGLNFDKV